MPTEATSFEQPQLQRTWPSSNKVVLQFEDREERCLTHGIFKSKRLLIGGTRPSGPWSRCPACVEMQVAQDKAATHQAQLTRTKDQQAQGYAAAIGQAGIPPRFINESFDSYVIENGSPESNQQRLILQSLQDYVREFEMRKARGTSLILAGLTGTGKTHLACSLVNRLVQQQHSAAYITAGELVQSIKDCWHRHSIRSAGYVINRFATFDFLVIDDVGDEPPAAKSDLFSIINKRYLNVKPTCLVTNLPLLTANPGENTLISWLGVPAIDRLRENGGFAHKFEWASYRRRPR